MSKLIRFLLLFLLLLGSCNEFKSRQQVANKAEYISRDLAEIKADGKLRALIAYSATSYFLYRGQPMGYEYELLKRLAEDLGVELELKVSRNLDDLLIELNKGIC